jgi:prepilin-type N-terminal cleavage/methylation domain-containing protein
VTGSQGDILSKTHLNTRPRQTRPATDRGLTLLETVLAVVILGLIAAAITGAISTAESMNTRARQTLAAHELAHRLILIALDDRDRLPAETLPLEYGAFRFMWDRSEEPVRMSVSDAQTSRGSAPQALSRFRLLNVKIYAAEGDSPQPYKGIVMASLSRVYDPAAPRNPESVQVYRDPRKVGELIEMLTDPANASRKSTQGRNLN